MYARRHMVMRRGIGCGVWGVAMFLRVINYAALRYISFIVVPFVFRRCLLAPSHSVLLRMDTREIAEGMLSAYKISHDFAQYHVVFLLFSW